MGISIEQLLIVSVIVYVLMGFVVRDRSSANYGGGPSGALTTIGHSISFLILLKMGWKVSMCVKVTPVKSFLYQTIHSIVMIKNPNAPYMSIHE